MDSRSAQGRSLGRTAVAAAVAVLVLAAGTIAPTQLIRGGDDASAQNQGYLLQVSKSGNGRVTSEPAGIDCGDDCSEYYDYAKDPRVKLVATPEAGERFNGWGPSGDCSGTGDCVVTMDMQRNVSASFSGAGAEPTPTPSPTPSPNPNPSPTPTPNPTPTPTPSPGPGTRPSLSLSYERLQSVSEQRGAVEVSVLCNKACRLRITGRLTITDRKTSIYGLPTAIRSLMENQRVKVRVRLTKPARQAVAKRASKKNPAVARLRFLATAPESRSRVVILNIRVIP